MDALERLTAMGTAFLYFLTCFAILFWPLILIFILLLLHDNPKGKRAFSAKHPILVTRSLTDGQLLLGMVAALLAFV